MFSNKVKTDESGIREPAQNLLHCEVDDNDNMIYMKSSQNGHSSGSQNFRLPQSSDDIFVMTPDVSEHTESTSSSDENFQESVISRKQGLKATAVSKMQLSDEYPMASTDNAVKEILEKVNSRDTIFQEQRRVLVEQKKIWLEKWSDATVILKRYQDTVSNIKDIVEKFANGVGTDKMKNRETFVERISDYIDHNDRMDEKYVMLNQIVEKMYTEVCGVHGKVTETRDLYHSLAMEVKKISDHLSSIDRQVKATQDLTASTLNRIMETVDKWNRNDSRSRSQLLNENYGHLPIVSPSHSIQGYNKPIISLPVSAYMPHNRNTGSALLNNSFQCLNSYDHKEKTDDFFDDIHFITKRKHRDLIFSKKSYASDCISKKNGPVNQRTLHPLDMNIDITGQKHIYQSASKTDDSMQVPDSQEFQITGKIDDNTTPKLDTDPQQIKLGADPKQTKLGADPKLIKLNVDPKLNKLDVDPKQIKLDTCPKRIMRDTDLKRIMLDTDSKQIKLDTAPKRIKLKIECPEFPEFPLSARIMSLKTKTSKNAVLPPNSKEKSHGKGCSIPPAPNSKKVYKRRSERNSICANKKPKESSSKAALSNSAKISPMTDDDNNDCIIIGKVQDNVPFNSHTNASKVPLSKGKMCGVKPDTIPLVG